MKKYIDKNGELLKKGFYVCESIFPPIFFTGETNEKGAIFELANGSRSSFSLDRTKLYEPLGNFNNYLHTHANAIRWMLRTHKTLENNTDN